MKRGGEELYTSKVWIPVYPSHITETSAYSQLPPGALCSAQSPVLLLSCDGRCFEFSNHSPDSATTSRTLRRKAASVQNILAFPITFLLCSLKKHCEISLWLSSLGFSYFPLVWLALSWLKTAMLTSPHLPACPLHTTTFELVLFPRDKDEYGRKGREVKEGKKLKGPFFHISCYLTHKWAGLIIIPREEQNGVSCGPILKHCFCNRRADGLYRPREADCVQANRVSRDILGREVQVALVTERGLQ